MKTKQLLLLRDIDAEDLFVRGFVFAAGESDFYRENIEHVMEILESPEFVELLINEFSLREDLFNRDDTYELLRIEFSYNVVFVFRNKRGGGVKFNLGIDHVTLVESE